MEDRLARTRLLLGDAVMEKLARSTVMVVGCGAVGGFAIEALARSGIGKLILVDFDVVKESNINRQIFALQSTLYQEKAVVARNRIRDISPDIQVEILPVLVNADTIDEVLDRRIDFVIDAIDTLNPKTILIEQLMARGIPFISSMGAALKTDASKIAIVPMKKTIHCPLAFFVRKRLRKRGVDLTFPVVYSSEDVSQKLHLEMPDQPENETGRVRHNMGSLPTITGIFGLLCANYAIDYLREYK
ncbi:MAG: tRNA threonylcarbamoyladenosine dehydratase [Alphaproteobacteria bacterium]|nr:tRNA threonylcarbamoyladenosine dehydratase [Alphaproteobacteria bacterium]